MSFGFIITRHVNSETTNNYWNECIQCIRRFYPFSKIVVIDDNSSQEFIKSEFEYKNIEIVQSEFPQRGELLPYYYFHKNRYFDNAVIIHDSVFFHKRLSFDKLVRLGIKVMPIWHFDSCKDENISNSQQISTKLKNNYQIIKNIQNSNKNSKYNLLGMVDPYGFWNGCFGVQSFINYHFLNGLQQKYMIFNLLDMVKTRPDRCCLERIMGIIFNLEYPLLKQLPSLLGEIFQYHKFGYTFQEYKEELTKYNGVKVPLIKVFSGR